MEKEPPRQKALPRDSKSKDKVASFQEQNQDLKTSLYTENGRP